MAGVEFAEGLEGGVIVTEEFDEGAGEFAGFGVGGEEGADPAIVGGEAAAGGGDGAVEGADFVGFADGGDDGFVLRNAEAGVAAVGGVDEGFEEGAADLLVEAADDGADFGEGGEVVEFARAEEFDVPVFDAGVGEVGFVIGAEVEFDVLGDAGLEFGVVGGWGSFEPGFDGGGVDLGDVVADGGVEVDEELGDGFVFVGWVHGVDAANHHDELGLEAEGAEGGDEGVGFFGEGGAEGGDLDEVDLDGGEVDEVASASGDDEFAFWGAGEFAVVIGDEGVEEAEVGAEDAEFDAGGVLDGCDGHEGKMREMNEWTIAEWTIFFGLGGFGIVSCEWRG